MLDLGHFDGDMPQLPIPKLADLVRAHDAAQERDLVEQLGAPIFVRLMVERKQNPLGITKLEHDPIEIDNALGEPVIRLKSSWTWLVTRPYGARPVGARWKLDGNRVWFGSGCFR